MSEKNDKLMIPLFGAETSPALIFHHGQVLFRMVTEGGTLIEKLISWEAVKEAATNIPIDSGWLSPEIARWGNCRFGDWAVAFIAPNRFQLELTDGVPGESETVERIVAPLPGMVIFGVTNHYHIWAVKGDRLDPLQEIYRAPLPNVMQDAEVCWGVLKPPQASAKSLLKAWQLFINSTFNNHAANGKSKSHSEDVRELLKELAAKGLEVRYPVEDLERQVKEGVTLDKAIKQFFESGEMPG